MQTIMLLIYITPFKSKVHQFLHHTIKIYTKYIFNHFLVQLCLQKYI
jgi:hypothetical protein